MDNEFNRYYIKIRTILGINAKTICEELTDALGYDAPKRVQKDFRQTVRKDGTLY